EVAGTVEVACAILLSIDEPSADGQEVSGQIRVSGWAAGGNPIVRVEVACDDVPVGFAEVGLPRPDVAACHPTLLAAERSGFRLILEPGRLTAGMHELTVQAFDTRRSVAKTTRQILVAPFRTLAQRPT